MRQSETTMMPSPHPNPPFETILVASTEVACDGGGGVTGHPKVYLHIERETNDVVCPYCSRMFVLKGGHR